MGFGSFPLTDLFNTSDICVFLFFLVLAFSEVFEYWSA